MRFKKGVEKGIKSTATEKEKELISIIKTRDSRILELEDEIRKLKQDK
jgi:hypothetical protein